MYISRAYVCPVGLIQNPDKEKKEKTYNAPFDPLCVYLRLEGIAFKFVSLQIMHSLLKFPEN